MHFLIKKKKPIRVPGTERHLIKSLLLCLKAKSEFPFDLREICQLGKLGCEGKK